MTTTPTYINNGAGNLSAAHFAPLIQETTLKPFPNKKRCRNEIESIAESVHEYMHQSYGRSWMRRMHQSPQQAFKPSQALKLLGFEMMSVETLGTFVTEGGEAEVAGLIDTQAKTISISNRFSRETQRFTGAHELGHAILSHQNGLHRDRPLTGTVKLQRDHKELEADWFATAFLLPDELVRINFKQRYHRNDIRIDDIAAFSLNLGNAANMRMKFRSLRDFSRYIASNQKVNGQFSISIAKHFGVSVEAMAIRLEQLGLVAK